MIQIDKFREERNSVASNYFQFLQKLKKDSNDVHAFFEGHTDSSFYLNFIHRFCEQKVHTYCCQSKKRVYEVYRKIVNSPYNKVKTLYFVDKDHSNWVEEEWEEAQCIYVTGFYAVENYLVSRYMLERIVNEMLTIPQGWALDDHIYDKFEAELQRFHNLATPLMAWAICMKRDRKSPIINNIKLTRFFYITDDLALEMSEEAQQIPPFSLLEKVCREMTSEHVAATVYTMAEVELKSVDPKMFIRGKLEVQFFIKFVEALLNHCNRNANIGDANCNIAVKMKTKLTIDNVVEHLGPRARIPPSLQRFLSLNLSQIGA